MDIEIQVISKQPHTGCLERFSFPSSTKIFTTSDELTLLRRCADSIKDQPNRSLKIVAQDCNNKIAFITKTLIHLGVSCGQINMAAYQN